LLTVIKSAAIGTIPAKPTRSAEFETASDAIAVRPPRHDLSIRRRNHERGIAGHHAQSVRGEIEIANHGGAEHAGDIRSRGSAAAWSDFFSYTAAADDFASLEDQHGEAGVGEVSRAVRPLWPAPTTMAS
jgi:hypothetical protein